MRNKKRNTIFLNSNNYSFMPAVLFFFLLLFFLSPPATSLGEEDFLPDYTSKRVNQAIEFLYNCDFEKAENLIEEIISEKPDDPMGYFYHAMVPWSLLAYGYWTEDMVEEYSKRIDKAISVARIKINKDSEDSFSYFYLGGSLGFKGRFQLMERRWVSSFFLAVDAINAFNKCLELDPENRDVLFGLGIYNYYLDRFSGFIRFFATLFMGKGDKKEGLRKIHLASETARYSSIEAKSFLVNIYMFLEKEDKKALPLIRELCNRFPDNPRFLFFKGILYSRLGMQKEYQEVIELLIEKKYNSGSVDKSVIWGNRAKYLIACNSLIKGDYDQAFQQFDKLMSETDPVVDPSMIAWPLFKKGMIFDLKGERESALEIFQQVKKMDNSAGAQYLAEKYFKERVEKNDRFLGY